MRNPDRIDDFCKDMSLIWKKNCPDLRFGQLMTALFNYINYKGKDPFFIEEAEMIEFFREYFGRELKKACVLGNKIDENIRVCKCMQCGEILNVSMKEKETTCTACGNKLIVWIRGES